MHSVIEAGYSKHLCRLVTALMLLGFARSALAWEDDTIRIQDGTIRLFVYGEHRAGNLIYHYTIANNGKAVFNNFTVGSIFDAKGNQTIPQLGKLPVGWKFGAKGEVGTEIILDPASSTQPQGWEPSVYGQQDSGYYYLTWRISESMESTPFLKPGQALSGFSVTVPPGADARLFLSPKESLTKYVEGYFGVGYWLSRKYYEFNGPIEKQDATPPTLSVTATPATIWPPNNKLAPVTITVSVKDDYDPQPEIKLESITSNDALASEDIKGAAFGADDRSFSLMATRAGTSTAGRIYTITYSATDGTGNKSIATTTVTVPHDQGK